MKKLYLFFLLFVISFSALAKNSISYKVLGNSNFGWDVYKDNDYRWSNFFIGTGYAERFETVPKAFWGVGGRINWNKYTLYNDGYFSMGASDAVLTTTSLSVPVQVGYQLFNKSTLSLNMYTGPVVEYIFNSKLDGFKYDRINSFNVGWSIGGSVRVLYVFRARVAYNYYPTTLLTDKQMPRRSLSLSLGI